MTDQSSWLAPHYSRFDVAGRVLLSGHSHQAWPDVARDGQLEAYDDAAASVDAKWSRAFAKADRLRAGIRRFLHDPDAELALGANTHELVLRFLSALELTRRPRLLTTDGEFHTLRRQLGRLAEERIEVVVVPADPLDTLATRLAGQVDDRTAAVMLSAVLYETGRIVPGLPEIARVCARRGAELLVDTYHALGVVPFAGRQLPTAWLVGGGYKYLQLGEGNCYLRIPPHAAQLRPVVTGWFAEFSRLEEASSPGRVEYPAGAARFAGATYDPTSHYRASHVLDFFDRAGMTPEFLQAVSRRQVGLLARLFDDLDAPAELISRDRATPPELTGGFLALRTPIAQWLHGQLEQRGVRSDSRGSYLRLGPAPYVSDSQLAAGITALGEALTRAASHRAAA